METSSAPTHRSPVPELPSLEREAFGLNAYQAETVRLVKFTEEMLACGELEEMEVA